MRNGLYKVAFRTPIGEGFGVVVLSDGKLSGGDSSMYYSGSYTQNGDDFRAEVSVATHTQVSGMRSVFGVPQGTIALTGKSEGDRGTMAGSSPQAPGIAFSAVLTRIGDF
jgi:hypothetical protein